MSISWTFTFVIVQEIVVPLAGRRLVDSYHSGSLRIGRMRNRRALQRHHSSAWRRCRAARHMNSLLLSFVGQALRSRCRRWRYRQWRHRSTLCVDPLANIAAFTTSDLTSASQSSASDFLEPRIDTTAPEVNHQHQLLSHRRSAVIVNRTWLVVGCRLAASLTSGNYVVGNGETEEHEINWREKPVSYIFV